MTTTKNLRFIRIVSAVFIIALVFSAIPFNNGDVFAANITEVEPNDKAINANTISIGDIVTGKTSNNGDEKKTRL